MYFVGFVGNPPPPMTGPFLSMVGCSIGKRNGGRSTGEMRRPPPAHLRIVLDGVLVRPLHAVEDVLAAVLVAVHQRVLHAVLLPGLAHPHGLPGQQESCKGQIFFKDGKTIIP